MLEVDRAASIIQKIFDRAEILGMSSSKKPNG
ncbi:hypothetical protein BN59_00921 [Legionella massiliensis]|uniref:Uncharacterized protein n=1 Tax=Legionella massiliensis TaxID=1034943 RepID=A0A078KUG8_9GAMM|nr:hypothetical protein BN59_00921 [Legionella massiliensis]CEE12385.1 hypothetical protein BN1094_00921 [Legionella massiliensis]